MNSDMLINIKRIEEEKPDIIKARTILKELQVATQGKQSAINLLSTLEKFLEYDLELVIDVVGSVIAKEVG